VNTAIRISQTIYSEDDLLYNQHVNKYLRFDPTLRRIQDPHIMCPNTKCDARDGPEDKKQVIYIKYDSKNMKYLYVCENCGETWKQIK
jgi:hypothetical protein